MGLAMRVPRLTFVVSALPRLAVAVMVFFIGTDVKFDDDESDALEVPRMVSDESDPVDLVRGRGDTLDVSVIVSCCGFGCGFCMYWYRGSAGSASTT